MNFRSATRTPLGPLVLVALAAAPGAMGQNIYVTNMGGVSLVNCSTGVILATIHLAGTPSGLALATGGQRLTRFAASSVAVLDTGSNTVVATIPVGAEPTRIAITANGLAAYVVNTQSNSVTVINTATNTVTATIRVGALPTSLAVTPDGGRVYVANMVSGTVAARVAIRAERRVYPDWICVARRGARDAEGGSLHTRRPSLAGHQAPLWEETNGSSSQLRHMLTLLPLSQRSLSLMKTGESTDFIGMESFQACESSVLLGGCGPMQDPMRWPLVAIATGSLASRFASFEVCELFILIEAFTMLCAIALWRQRGSPCLRCVSGSRLFTIAGYLGRRRGILSTLTNRGRTVGGPVAVWATRRRTSSAPKVSTLLVLVAMSCTAAEPFRLTLIGNTATQIAFSYPAPSGEGFCLIKASTGYAAPNTWGSMAADVDTTIFGNANVDLERASTLRSTNPPTRTVVIGQRTSQLATATVANRARHYSRALQAATTYYIGVDCPGAGTTSSILTAATTNIPLGNTYGDPWLSDAARPGDQPWPEAVGGLAPESFIDPLTGLLLQRIGLRGNNWGYWGNIPFGSAFNAGQTTPCDTAGPWTSPCSLAVGSGNTTVGASTAPLVLRPPLTGNNAWNTGYGGSNYGWYWTIEQLSVALTGYVNSTTTNSRLLDICLSLNGGASCASAIAQMPMGQSSGQQTVGQADTAQFGVIPWVLDTNPRFNVQESSPHSGTATVAGNTVTWVSGDLFSLYWVTGGNGHIRLSANNDACTTPPNRTTSTEYTITGFVDGNRLTVSGAPPAGNVYWCANNFAVRVWRDQVPTDGSVVTLTRASMAVVESSTPTYPDNGAGTACYNTPVSNGSGQNGYFCMYGGLYWIDPTAPANDAYYGFGGSSGMDGSGTPIANSWNGFGFPLGESADIDQTKSALTFYGVALDPAGGGPLVIQGVFNPSSVSQPIAQPTTPQRGGAQIGNASVSSTTAYSVTYNNGLTFTNLTPQTSMQESVVQQMAAFDPTFNPTMFSTGPNGWNCGPAAVSLGIFYFYCVSGNQDTPGWIFAFSPGDANPAHAGQSGGPRVVGAVNTFNTPNGPVAATQTAMTGRSLHSIEDTGETGWIQIQENVYRSINTSSIASIPALSPDCSTFGLPAGRQCIQIDIDSHTGGGVTGYEPYLPSPQYQFKGAPGELRTAQLGDTACVAASTVSSCSWPGQANELMTLAIKNYNGVNGAWVFQRNSYGAELAIPSGPVTLWWISNQWIIPPGGTTANGSMAAYWNPLTGCNGSPDPHGNCLIQDTNNTDGHGEWRDGGSAVSTNVAGWGQPILGWPTDYQTVVGSVLPVGTTPSILNMPFANVTPGQVEGVSYTSANPGFACNASECTYGVPWGSDGGTHPNPAGASDPNNGIYAFDNLPVQGGARDPTFTLVAGQLYVATPPSPADPDNIFGCGSVASINRKIMATGASCGSHPLIDLSGPGSTIATGISQPYTYCVARTTGECQSGSAVGQVYVNCPGVVWPFCSGTATHGGTPMGIGNDICVANIGASANTIRQFALAPPGGADPAGAYTRNLVSATSRLRMVYGFENNRLLPDGSWLLFRAEWLNYQRSDMWMAKLPCYPGTVGCPTDNQSRGQFIWMAVPIPAHGGAGAVVEFGYQEDGAPTALNCTTRNDPCLATATSIENPPYSSPYYFKSEQPPAVNCSTGCTIMIPAVSQRMLFYRVLYLSGAQQIGATAISVVNVP